MFLFNLFKENESEILAKLFYEVSEEIKDFDESMSSSLFHFHAYFLNLNQELFFTKEDYENLFDRLFLIYEDNKKVERIKNLLIKNSHNFKKNLCQKENLEKIKDIIYQNYLYVVCADYEINSKEEDSKNFILGYTTITECGIDRNFIQERLTNEISDFITLKMNDNSFWNSLEKDTFIKFEKTIRKEGCEILDGNDLFLIYDFILRDKTIESESNFNNEESMFFIKIGAFFHSPTCLTYLLELIKDKDIEIFIKKDAKETIKRGYSSKFSLIYNIIKD